VSAARRTVGQAENNMNVKAGLAVVADGYLADRTQDFTLLGDLDFLVDFLFRIEPTVAFSKAPMALSEAAVIPASFANFVSAANASSPNSRMTTRVSAPASPANFKLFMIVKPRCAGYGGLP
jgi:hypothetical protein